MTYYLSLGANLGEREQTIRQTLQLIEQQIGPVLRCSSFYYSEPWGFESEHAFCNLCCAVETSREPMEVLHLTQMIERALGRTKKTEIQQQSDLTSNSKTIYSDRSIDIDLIKVYEDGKEVIMDTQELTLPHRLWQERDFVKVPLVEIMQ